MKSVKLEVLSMEISKAQIWIANMFLVKKHIQIFDKTGTRMKADNFVQYCLLLVMDNAYITIKM